MGINETNSICGGCALPLRPRRARAPSRQVDWGESDATLSNPIGEGLGVHTTARQNGVQRSIRQFFPDAPGRKLPAKGMISSGARRG
jgi:hypothetical protein